MNKRWLSRLALGALPLALLAACAGSDEGPGAGGTLPDTDPPTVHVTSGATSATREYELTGIAYDDRAVASVTWSLAGGAENALELAADTFTGTVTLQPGSNELAVTATDTAGNERVASVEIQYLPTPADLSLDRDAGLPGQEVVLGGSGLGETGTLELGGVPITFTSWTDSRIEFRVPAGAKAGPQPLSVSTASGSAQLEFFVGMDFTGDTLEELTALALPKGTAVRLPAGTITGTSADVRLDNLSLYGNGRDSTVISVPGGTSVLTAYADSGFDLTWRDLRLEVDSLFVHPEPVISAAGGSSAQSFGAGSLNWDNLTLIQQAGGAGLQIDDSGHHAGVPNTFTGDVLFQGVTIDSLAAAVNLSTYGNILISDSSISGTATTVAAIGHRVLVDNSELNSRAAALTVTGNRGLTLTDSLMVAAGPLVVNGAPASSADYHLAGENLIRGTDFELQDEDTRDHITLGPARSRFLDNTVNSTGDLRLEVTGSLRPAEIAGNELTARYGINFHLRDEGSALSLTGNRIEGYSIRFDSTVPGNELLVTDNQLVAADDLRFELRFDTGGAVVSDNSITVGSEDVHSGGVSIHKRGAALFSFTDNVVSHQGPGLIFFFGNGTVEIDRNDVTGFGGSDQALMFIQQGDELIEVRARDNRFAGFSSAVYMSSASAYTGTFRVRLNGNHFDFPIQAAPDTAEIHGISAARGDLDATGNIWGDNTEAATVASYITYVDSDAVFQVDPLALP